MIWGRGGSTWGIQGHQLSLGAVQACSVSLPGSRPLPSPAALQGAGGHVCTLQNIDTLERVAGLDQEDLVEAHGTFFTSHCLGSSCKKKYTLDWMKGTSSPGSP